MQSDLYWYSSVEDYCASNGWYFVSLDSEYEGFQSAVRGGTSDPSSEPSGSRPSVPSQPTVPTDGERVGAYDVVARKLLWSTSSAALFGGSESDAALAGVGWPRDGDGLLALTVSISGDGDSKGRRLVVLDATSGAVKSSIETDPTWFADVLWVSRDSIGVVGDGGAVKALDPSDLARTKWEISNGSEASDTCSMGVYFPCRSILLGKYLLTDDGYLNISDGSPAGFARDADGGTWLVEIQGSRGQLMKIKPSPSDGDSAFTIRGFDPAKDLETWEVEGRDVRQAGKILVVSEPQQITGYRVNGNELERVWRERCSADCRIVETSTDLVVIGDSGDAYDEYRVLSAENGETLEVLGGGTGNRLGPVLFGNSVMYFLEGRESDGSISQVRFVAVDLKKSGLPVLWRSPDLDVSDRTEIVNVAGNIVITRRDKGAVGVLDAKGGDWAPFVTVN